MPNVKFKELLGYLCNNDPIFSVKPYKKPENFVCMPEILWKAPFI